MSTRWAIPLAAILACLHAPAARSQEAEGNDAQAGEEGGRAALIASLGERGGTQISEGDWTGAARTFEKILKLNPDDQTARFSLATAYLKLDRYREALPMLMQLATDFPDNPAVRNNLAWTFVKCADPEVRDPEKGRRYARDALLLAPGDHNVWGTLAEAYYALGQYERAKRVAAVAMQLSRAADDPGAEELRELYDRCRIASGEDTVGGEPLDDASVTP